MTGWNGHEYGHVGKKIACLQKHLEGLELQASSPEVIKDLRETRVELNCWLNKEDAMWEQRARLNWFQEGDQTPVSFMQRLQQGFKRIQLRGFFMLKMCGRLTKERLRRCLLSTTLIYLLP